MASAAGTGSTTAGTRARRRETIAATTVGNALEFFDFTVYGFLALVIGRLFFPTFDSNGQLLLAIATFGVGFVMRPLGGIVIGAYADRAGRKKAMTLTIFLMALGCAIIAFTPTYASIGAAAPAAIVLARLIQGFSAGGEVGASTTLLVEHATPADRGYMASWQYASQGLGVLLGAVMVAALTFLLTPQAMASWGWRLPFIAGMAIAPVGLVIRRRLHESLHVAAGPRPNSLAVVCRDHRATVLAAVFSMIGSTTAAYVVTFYMPAYAVRELGLPPSVALSGAALTGLVAFVAAPWVGRLSDRAGRKPLIVWGRIALSALILPGFLWLASSPTPAALYAVLGVFSLVLALQAVPSVTMLPEMFPKAVRASGMSLVYSLGVALFGGFAPLTSTWLLAATGSKLAPAWYLVAMTLVSLAALPWLRDQAGRDIDAPGAQEPA